MAITINRDSGRDAPAGAGGRGAFRPALWNTNRQMKVVTGSFDLDNSYPTGGYDISSLWASRAAGGMFAGGPYSVFVQDTDGTRLFAVDYTAKKLKAFTALGTEVGSGVNLSTVTGVRFLAIGP